MAFSAPSDLTHDSNEKCIVQEFSSTPLKDDNSPTENHGLTVYFSVGYAQKVKEFKNLLSKVGEDPLEGLNMIDAVVRLGIDYHFQEEIEAILQAQRQFFISSVHDDCVYDLHEVSLHFRLLRQEGYHVSADMFEKFKDNRDGKFKSKLGEDIKGLMELYEASQVSIEGEDILDEARDFSYQLLKSWVKNLDQHRPSVVLNTLEHPHHKSLRSFLAKDFLNNFQGTKDWINVLKELTEMDFKQVKYIRQKDILQISKWWKDLGLAKELKFARDQPLKWYIWTMGCLTDPSLSEQRVELTKPVSLVYIIDDIFDVYGTLDELTLFTEAVNRWEFAAAEGLPDYMKTCFKALYATTNEISYKVYEKHGWNPVDSLQKAWARLCNAFLVEAEWFGSGKLPKTEEYLKNAVLSTGIHVVLVHMFFLLGQGINKETVHLLDDDIPTIISSTATILRLWDDLGSAKDENQNGNDGSYIECYMKDNQGCSVEEARNHVIQMISAAWKSLNQSCLISPNPFPASFIKASLNAARMVPLMYNYKDTHQLQSLMEHMKSLLTL